MGCYKRDYVFKTIWCWYIVYQVHCNKQFTEEDEKRLDKELEELERKIKAVSNFEIIHHPMNLWCKLNEFAFTSELFQWSFLILQQYLFNKC